MVVALGAHSFAPTSHAPLAGQGRDRSEPASPPHGGQGAPGATSSSEPWVAPWVMAERSKTEQAEALAEIFRSVPLEKQIEALFPLAPVKVDYVSPSAIETIDLCERKWAFVKLDRLDKGFSASAQLGTDTHSQHERWFIDGVPYDLTTRAGELALATSDLLPPRDTPGLRVEQEMRFAWPSIPGGLLGGKIDLNWRAYVAHIVLDHKTSSNVEQYGKLTRDALLHHPQAPVYGAFGIWFSGPAPAEAVELRWNYVNTKGKPKGTPSWHIVRPEEIHAAVEQYVAPGARRLLQIVDQANQTRASGTPFGAKDLPFPDPGKKACTAFGGCPFRSVCGISPAKGIVNMVDASQDFLQRMGLAPAPLPPAPVAPLPPAVQNLAVPPVGYGHSAPAVLPGYPAAPPGAPTVSTMGPGPQMGYGGQVNPPEAQLPPPAPPAAPPAPAAPPQGTVDVSRRKRRTKAEMQADLAASSLSVGGQAITPLTQVEYHTGDEAPALSFLESAVLAVLPVVVERTLGMVIAPAPGAQAWQPATIAALALEIAKAAAQGVEGN